VDVVLSQALGQTRSLIVTTMIPKALGQTRRQTLRHHNDTNIQVWVNAI